MNFSKNLGLLIIKKVYIYRNLQKDYAVFVGAEFNQYRGWSTNKSRLSEKELKKILDARLIGKLETLGKLAHKRNGNYLGNCAEVHASNKVLTQSINARVDQITFTNAYRCRTLQVIPYCPNCLDTFNL